MIPMQWRKFPIKLKEAEGKQFIYDEIRKKWLICTPEEWVRQNIIWYLIEEKQYPKQLIAVEKLIQYNQLKKRFDIVIYNRDWEPWMLVECKSPHVPIDQNVLFQTLTYHAVLHCKYWLMSNGQRTFCATLSADQNIEWLEAIPNHNH